MKKLFIYVALVLSVASCKKDASREVVLAETPSGRSFHFMPIYEDGVTDITITIAWPMLWAFEAEKNQATPYVAGESILSGGTDNLAPQEVLEIFNDNNANGRLYTNANYAVGEVSFPKEHISDIVSIVSEMLTSPQIDQSWIKRTKQGILAQQNESQKLTGHQMWSAARMAVLGDGPLNEYLSLSNLDAIETVQESDLRQWHEETLVQSGVTIVVTGAISRKDAGKAIDSLLSGLPEGGPVEAPDLQPDFRARTILLHLPNAEKSTLGFVGQLPPTTEGGDITDLLALNFFARTGSGPLFNVVRTQLRASYGFQAGYTNYDRATRIMFIGGEVETSKLAETSSLILDTYEAYRTNPDLTGLDELRQGMADGAKKNVKYVDVAARSILEIALDGLDTSNAPRVGKLLGDTQANDIRNRLDSVFPPGNSLIVVAASPEASALPGACVVTEIEQIAQCP